MSLDEFDSLKNIEIKYMNNQFNNFIDDKKNCQCELIIDEGKKIIKSINLKNVLNEASDDMWKKIRELYDTKNVDKTIINYLKNVGTDKKTMDIFIKKFFTVKNNTIRYEIIDHIKKLSYQMKEKRFNNLFKLKNNKPRIWKNNDPIDDIYEKAVKNTTKLVNLFSVFKFDININNKNTDIPKNLILIDEIQRNNYY